MYRPSRSQHIRAEQETNFKGIQYNMNTNYHRRLFTLAHIVIFLIFLSIVNCTSDQMKKTLLDNRMRATATIKNHLYDTLEEEKFKNDYDREIQHVISGMLKMYPHRRAAAFHAMRGKSKATSTPAERKFSKSGLLMTPHRSRLSTDTLSKLTFVKCNATLIS
ncbi:unnamed protein product [Rotaria socialis]